MPEALALRTRDHWVKSVEKKQDRRLIRFGPVLFLGMGLVLAGLVIGSAAQTQQPDESTRKLISSVPPEYPELARRLNLRGTARVEVTVAPDGRVIRAKEVGGNPVLVEALIRAVKKWKYEAAKKESLIEVKFEFNP
jgi:TonB family protein